MQTTIEVQGLTKRYGDTLAVDGLSFTVPAGRVTGFVGPNGAGKSTTMRMILGLDAPNAGAALVNGRAYAALSAPLREIGALLDAGALHPGRRAYDHLLWLALSNDLPRARVDEVLELVGLTAVAPRRRGRGHDRLGMAGDAGDPRLLVEPASTASIAEGMRMIGSRLPARAGAPSGRAVLVPSHLMSELQGTADHLDGRAAEGIGLATTRRRRRRHRRPASWAGHRATASPCARPSPGWRWRCSPAPARR